MLLPLLFWANDIIKSDSWCLENRCESKVFAIRKTFQIIKTSAPAKISLLFGNIDNRGAGKDDFQIGVEIIQVFDMLRPSGIFMNLIKKKIFATLFIKISPVSASECVVKYRSSREK